MDDIWNTYETRIEQSGVTRREEALKRIQSRFRHKIFDSLSCHDVLVEGKEQTVAILNKSDLSKKKICALPGERLVHGGYVDYENSKWIITEIDASNEVYESGLMTRCNHLLRWLNSDGKVIEKWSIVEDGTKYLIGEQSQSIMTIGDARIAVTLPKDEDTIALGRGKRFLIDDVNAQEVLAYEITKSNRLFNVYNDRGVFRYIMGETQLTDNDNVELRIADFYNWSPHIPLDNEHRDKDISLTDIVADAKEKAEQPDDDGKRVWI